MKGLIIKSPWIDLIFEWHKTWEIRGSNTNIRGEVALIKSGTGMIFGTVDVVDSIPLTESLYETSFGEHRIKENYNQLPYKKPYAWILENPVVYPEPIPYKHPQGAVIWVNLDREEEYYDPS